jgi:hypothetical protein
MSLTNDTISDFERNVRAVLEHSVMRIDAPRAAAPGGAASR